MGGAGSLSQSRLVVLVVSLELAVRILLFWLELVAAADVGEGYGDQQQYEHQYEDATTDDVRPVRSSNTGFSGFGSQVQGVQVFLQLLVTRLSPIGIHPVA